MEEIESSVYRNNLKNREFGQEAPQIFDSERVTIAEGQGTSENQKVGVRPTQPKTDSSGCFGIHPIFIRTIEQKDLHRFTIEWSDGMISEYRLCDLQRMCSCAECRDEKTGRMLIDPSSISDDLQALRIVSVGRYALQIFFSQGCSKGIYSFKLLRSKR